MNRLKYSNLFRRISKLCWKRNLRRKVVTLSPVGGATAGKALLAYRLEAFMGGWGSSASLISRHTMFMESVMIADVLLALGYEVDVIDFENKTFVPRKNYGILISARKNFQRYADLVGPGCIKIAHLDTSHWMVNNAAALGRCCEVQKSRWASLRSYRLVEENLAIETADCGVLLGDDVSAATYAFSGKRIYQLPVPVCRRYPKPEKNYAAVRKTFLWLGSRGFVHKGLDLVLEAFAELPDFRLMVCGPIEEDREFKRAFSEELFCRPNIKTIGWIDVASPEFVALANSCIGMVYSSCAEGQSGAVITGLHVGLIPILSKQAGVAITPEYGIRLHHLSAGEIQERVRELAGLPPARLEEMSLRARSYAQEHHTRANYLARYTDILQELREFRRHTSGPLLASGEMVA